GAVGICPSPSAAIGLVTAANPDPALATSTGCQHRSTVTDATVAGRWNLDRFELSGEAGHRMGPGADVMRDSRFWASASMTMWVAPRAAIVAGGGRQPSTPARGIPSRTFGSLGMVLSYLSPSRNGVPLTPATVMVRSFGAAPSGD